ncbi:MAG: hypothetical protein U9Q70_00175, partial [Chloroflexota bacterium]|nr:hypothetical protein [Chloroflexota bacterium]
IEDVWPEAKIAFLKLFDFLENHLYLKGPEIIPYRYFYMSLITYFFESSSPNYDFLKKYFWFYSFHNDNLLSNTTHLRNHIDFLNREKSGKIVAFDRFLIDRHRLRTSSYSSRGRLSRAILSLLANQGPRGWANPDKRVLLEVYYLLTDKPNLHHIFPRNFVINNPGKNKLDYNSLMNIAYLPQITNLKISDENPVTYVRNYDSPAFEEIMDTHLLPREILNWARENTMPENALDIFIERRVDMLIEALKQRLQGINFEVIDTQEMEIE